MKKGVIAHYLLYVACITVLTVGIFVFSLLLEKGNEKSRSLWTQDALLLQTSSIEVLPPHGHVVGVDSMTDDGHHVNVVSQIVVAPRDAWVRGISYEIEGAPALTLHHGTVFKLDSRDLECPDQSPQPLLSLAQDQEHTNSMTFEEGYGIFIKKGTPLLLDAMFHNPEEPIGPGDIYTDVSLKVHLALADDPSIQYTPVTYHLLRLADEPCSIGTGHTFIVPPNTQGYVHAGTKAENDASVLTLREPSRIVYWGAHMHGWEGGEAVIVKKNTEVIEIFKTVPSDDEPYRFDTPHGPSQVLLDAGDKITIEAIYNNATDSPLRGAMGHLGVYLAPR